MADSALQGKPATQLSGLRDFAGEVFSNSQGKYTLDDYDYLDDTSLFSTACFTTANNGLATGQQILYTAPFGGTGGQGFPAGYPMSLAETNLQTGQAGGKFPQNQAYAGIAGGFDIYCIPAGQAPGVFPTGYNSTGGINIPDASDLFQIASSVTWQWNVGGLQSPTLVYEPLKAWPCGFGTFGIGAVGTVQAASNGGPVSTMRKFAFPLMFPPNTAAQLTVAVRRAVTNLVSLNNGSLVLVAMHMRGYMLSKVR